MKTHPLSLLECVSAVYISSVTSPDWLEALTAQALAQNLPVFIASTQAYTRINHSILTNGYSQVGNMGVDRWLAMSAAVGLFPEQSHFVVVDAGTAITCDVIYRHAHLGGWIAPGLQLLTASLLDNTEQVFTDSKQSTSQSTLFLGKNTPEMCSSRMPCSIKWCRQPSL